MKISGLVLLGVFSLLANVNKVLATDVQHDSALYQNVLKNKGIDFSKFELSESLLNDALDTYLKGVNYLKNKAKTALKRESKLLSFRPATISFETGNLRIICSNSFIYSEEGDSSEHVTIGKCSAELKDYPRGAGAIASGKGSSKEYDVKE